MFDRCVFGEDIQVAFTTRAYAKVWGPEHFVAKPADMALTAWGAHHMADASPSARKPSAAVTTLSASSGLSSNEGL